MHTGMRLGIRMRFMRVPSVKDLINGLVIK
jgi:hypothetical protein